MVAFARPAARRLSLLAAALLAACAAGGPLTAPRGATPVATQQTLAAADGSRIAASEWGPGRPAAVILALHGFGDHGQSTFADAARVWAERDILTVAIDQRGFGRNPSRGLWPGEDALVADAVAASRQLRARFPCVPLTVVGHSMGGGVALAAAAQGLAGEGIVLAAPAIWGGEYLNPIHRLLAWTAAVVVPDRRYTGRGIVKIRSTDNDEALRQMRKDPLYLGKPSSRELMGLIRVTDAARAAAERVDRPALLLLGDKDQIVPNRRVREVFATLRGPKDVVEYPEGWHLLFRDLQAPNVWRDVADWALSRPAPACADGRPPAPVPPVTAPTLTGPTVPAAGPPALRAPDRQI